MYLEPNHHANVQPGPWRIDADCDIVYIPQPRRDDAWFTQPLQSLTKWAWLNENVSPYFDTNNSICRGADATRGSQQKDLVQLWGFAIGTNFDLEYHGDMTNKTSNVPYRRDGMRGDAIRLLTHLDDRVQSCMLVLSVSDWHCRHDRSSARSLPIKANRQNIISVTAGPMTPRESRQWRQRGQLARHCYEQSENASHAKMCQQCIECSSWSSEIRDPMCLDSNGNKILYP